MTPAEARRALRTVAMDVIVRTTHDGGEHVGRVCGDRCCKCLAVNLLAQVELDGPWVPRAQLALL